MGRSHCDHCKKTLEWVDLIPVVSYIFLGARCRRCNKKLSFFYPLVELITGFMFVGVLYWLGPMKQIGQVVDINEALLNLHTQTLLLIALLGIVACSIVIFFADFKYQIIPDSIQVALFGFAFLFIITQGVTPKIFLNQVAGAFVTMLPILLLFAVTKGKGMGFGDVKLAFTMGFMLGILGGLAALYIGFITGAVIGIILMLIKMKRLKSKIAFGPFLIIGFLTMTFFGSSIDQLIRSIYTF